MSRVRWGNVARLATLLAAAALIAFGPPRFGCGRDPEVIPLDALPGEPLEAPPPEPVPRARPQPPLAPPRPAATRPPRDQRRRRPRPARGRVRLGREAVAAASPVARRPHGATVPLLTPIYGGESGMVGRLRVPEAAREFSFDR